MEVERQEKGHGLSKETDLDLNFNSSELCGLR